MEFAKIIIECPQEEREQLLVELRNSDSDAELLTGVKIVFVDPTPQMDAAEYMRKVAVICKKFEGGHCDRCPLNGDELACGMPHTREEQAEALRVVAAYQESAEPYICPRCLNEEHSVDAKFCKICGLRIEGGYMNETINNR